MSSFINKLQRLRGLADNAEMNYEVAKALAARQGRSTPVRHKCFISYHGADIDVATTFVENFSNVFIPRVVGASDSDHFEDPINSTDEEYIKDQIGSKYLADSTVTIALIGGCTWSRKYVDWEISSTLKNGAVNKRNGLLAITLPDLVHNKLPKRVDSNVSGNNSKYGTYRYYPQNSDDLRNWIEDAFAARTSRAHLIENREPLRKHNSTCN